MDTAVQNAKDELRTEVRRLLLHSLVSSKPGPSTVMLVQSHKHNVPSNEAEMVARFLKQYNMHYTLSVFVAEAQLDPNKDYDVPVDLKHAAANKPDVEPNLKILAEQIWQSVDRKFQAKMTEHQQKSDAAVRQQIAALKQQYKEALMEKEQEMDSMTAAKIEEFNQKEQQLLANVTLEKNSQTKAAHDQKKELLAQMREIDLKRIQLQQLEEQFSRHMESERATLQHDKECLALQQSALDNKRIQMDAQIDSAARRIREEEKRQYAKTLAILTDREKVLRQGLQSMDARIRALLSQKEKKENKEFKLKDLQLRLGQSESECERLAENGRQLRNRLRGMADYERVKERANRMEMELEKIADDYAHDPMRKQLEAQVAALREQKSLIEKSNILREEEWKLRIRQEKSRYEELSRLFKSQSQQLKELTKEISKLRSRLEPSSQNAKGAKRAVATRFEWGTNRSDQSEVDEISSASTPEFVKDARARLKHLDKEAEKFNQSLQELQSARQRSDVPDLTVPSLLLDVGLSAIAELPEAASGRQVAITAMPLDAPPAPNPVSRLTGGISQYDNIVTSTPKQERQIPITSLPNAPAAQAIPSSTTQQHSERQVSPERQISITSTPKATEQHSASNQPTQQHSERQVPVPSIQDAPEGQIPIAPTPNAPIQQTETTTAPRDIPPVEKQPETEIPPDSWEAKLRKRQEEKKRLEEERREMEEREKEKKQKEVVVEEKKDENIPEKEQPPEPKIDPVMQKYMEMVMKQRSKEKTEEKPEKTPIQKSEEKIESDIEEELEIASVGKKSDVDSDSW